MRPIASPKDALWICGDESLCQRRDVGVIRCLGRHAVTPAGNLDVRLSALHQIDQRTEAGLLNAWRGTGSAEMIEHERDRRSHEVVMQSFDDVQRRIELDVPPTCLHSCDCVLKSFL